MISSCIDCLLFILHIDCKNIKMFMVIPKKKERNKVIYVKSGVHDHVCNTYKNETFITFL